MQYRKIRFSPAEQTEKKKKNFLDYHHDVDHHIQIESHDRYYSNVDLHQQVMLSTKTEERPTEKHAERKMLVRCLLGNA